MTQAEERLIKRKIKRTMESHANIGPDRMDGLLPNSGLSGKLYEAAVLAEVCKKLHEEEGFTIRLSEGTSLRFRQKGGKITDRFPFLRLIKHGRVVAELHLDIYFTTISYERRNGPHPEPGDYHELDIALVIPDIREDYPSFKDILIAIECKNTTLQKHIIREILGYRRELAYLHDNQDTEFANWPAREVPANPPSVQIFYCSDEEVNIYQENCNIFGIKLEWFQM